MGAQIQQVFLVLRDRIVQVGQGMIAAGTAIARFFKGDFKGAAEAAVEANNLLISSFQGVIDEIVEEVEQVGNLERALIDLEKAENDFLVRRAAIRREQAELLIITRDQTRSFAEQFDALERINELESERLRTEIDLQRRRLAQEFGLLDLTEERIQKIIEEGIALEELGLNISNEEDRAKAIEEVVKLLDLETASITRNREILNRFVELSNRFRGQQRKELQELINLQRINLEQREQLAPDEIPEVLDLNNQLIQSLQRVVEADNARTRQEIQNSKNRLDAKKVEEEGKLELTKSFFELGLALTSENAAAELAIKIPLAIADTFGAANKALNNPPGPPFTIPLAAATIIRGLANVAQMARAAGSAGGGVSETSFAGNIATQRVRQQTDRERFLQRTIAQQPAPVISAIELEDVEARISAKITAASLAA